MYHLLARGHGVRYTSFCGWCAPSQPASPAAAAAAAADPNPDPVRGGRLGMMFLSPEDPDVDCDTELARMLKACEEARTSNRELLLLSKRIEAQTADLMALDEEEDSREKASP